MRNHLSHTTAVLIVGHGSKHKGFQAAMQKVAKDLRRDKKLGFISCCYLEINSPSIPEAIDLAIKKGATQVRVLPYFLLTGMHVKKHIPQIVALARKQHGPRVKIRLCPYLGYDPKIVQVVRERIRGVK